MNISIFGMGNVGSAIASHILSSDLKIEEIYLFDTDIKKLMGNYHDLLDMREVLGKQEIEINMMKLDLVDRIECDIYIITAGFPRSSGAEDHNYARNLHTVLDCISRCNGGKIWVVTNPIEKIYIALNRIGINNVTAIGSILDKSRYDRTLQDPEKTALRILNNKGYTNFGVVAEILKRLNDLQKVECKR